jgi:hypothetical protein
MKEETKSGGLGRCGEIFAGSRSQNGVDARSVD